MSDIKNIDDQIGTEAAGHDRRGVAGNAAKPHQGDTGSARDPRPVEHSNTAGFVITLVIASERPHVSAPSV
jgi:hypothetical protein